MARFSQSSLRRAQYIRRVKGISADAMASDSRDDSGRTSDCVFMALLLLSGPRIRHEATHHGHEQVGNARTAHLAERRELLTIDTVEEQDAASKYLSFVNGFERARRGHVLRVDHYFHIARLELLHAAMEHNPATMEEHEIGEHVLDL